MAIRNNHVRPAQHDARSTPPPPSSLSHKKKKAGARSKNGCLTCRMRRKRCDEQKHPGCLNCKRLHIECLGYSNKRPEWMRDQKKLEACKTMVKNYLTQRNMIKGKSRTSSSYEGADILTFEVFSGDHLSFAGSNSSGDTSETSPSPREQTPELSPDTSDRRLALGGYGTDILGVYRNGIALQFGADPHASLSASGPFYPPTIRSTFSDLYYPNNLGDQLDQEQSPLTPLSSVWDSSFYSSPSPSVNGDSKEQGYFQHYLHSVFHYQYYLLKDREAVEHDMRKLFFTHIAAKYAVCAVSAQHQARLRNVTWANDEISNDAYNFCEHALTFAKYPGKPLHEGDAMAGLHGVSFTLFAGGSGEWDKFLSVACDWLESRQISELTWASLPPMTSFLTRATMWMDILGSVTNLKTPRFLHLYRALFLDKPGPSMEDVMGCSSRVMLAIAEIAALAQAKHQQEMDGVLSMPTLIEHGRYIEKLLVEAQTPFYTPFIDPAQRHLGTDVFRAAAKALLHSVLSGCSPKVKEIEAAVSETIIALQKVKDISAFRSLVFPICISGCLADVEHQAFFTNALEQTLQYGNGNIGNCREALNLMQAVWRKRSQLGRRGAVVCWRETMREQRKNILLA